MNTKNKTGIAILLFVVVAVARCIKDMVGEFVNDTASLPPQTRASKKGARK